MVITANDLKIKGMTFINNMIHKYGEVFEKDYRKGRYVTESAKEHFKRLGI